MRFTDREGKVHSPIPASSLPLHHKHRKTTIRNTGADVFIHTKLFTAFPRIQKSSFITGGAVGGEKIHYRCLTLRGAIKLRTVTCSSFFVPKLARSHREREAGGGKCTANRLQNPISKTHVIPLLNLSVWETREFEKHHSALNPTFTA